MIGKNFDDFTIIDIINKGGMGEVYLAVQNSLDRNVAIKIIFCNQNLHEKELVERFIREAKLTASIQHPNIISIYKVGQYENFYYIAMEYISWSSLEGELKKGSMNEVLSWEIVLQICLGLQKTLQNGIIHRDIKPGNILLQNSNHAILTDFGLSKQMEADVQITQAGAILGTPAYISPEQIQAKEVDFRSDIYSLGATAYHMLTGKAVFDGDSNIDVLCKHKTELPISPKCYKPDLKQQSIDILAKMLQKNPRKRYQAYGDLIIDIQCLLANKNLYFASYEDAFTCYQKSTLRNPKTTTTTIIKSFFSFIGRDSLDLNNSDCPFIWLERNEKLHTLAHQNSIFHVMSTYTELRTFLKNSPAVVLLETNSLSSETINFIHLIQEDFPETPVCIVMDSIPDYVDNSECRSFFINKNSVDLEKNLIQYYTQKKYNAMKDVCLDVCLVLGRFYKWTLCLCDENQNSKIYLKQGEVKDISSDQLSELTKTRKKWKTISKLSIVDMRKSEIQMAIDLQDDDNSTLKKNAISKENICETKNLLPVIDNNRTENQNFEEKKELDIDDLFERMAARAEKNMHSEKIHKNK